MDAFADLDLNLIRSLDALLVERSVTRAAARLGLSQPAMSHALARLRERIGDPLLVRAGRELVLTPRAIQLQPRASAAMQAARAVFEAPDRFEPMTVQATVTIYTNDYAELTLLPPLIGRLTQRAPGLDVSVRSLSRQTLEDELSASDADLALLLGEPANWPASLHHTRLFDDRFVTAMRRDHPAAGRALDLSTYTRYPHVLISRRGDNRGVVDLFLEKVGATRRVAATVPTFPLAVATVARTDYFLNANRRYLEAWPGCEELHLAEPPVELPVGALSMLWHARTQKSALHRWLRAEIGEVAREVNAGLGR